MFFCHSAAFHALFCFTLSCQHFIWSCSSLKVWIFQRCEGYVLFCWILHTSQQTHCIVQPSKSETKQAFVRCVFTHLWSCTGTSQDEHSLNYCFVNARAGPRTNGPGEASRRKYEVLVEVGLKFPQSWLWKVPTTRPHCYVGYHDTFTATAVFISEVIWRCTVWPFQSWWQSVWHRLTHYPPWLTSGLWKTLHIAVLSGQLAPIYLTCPNVTVEFHLKCAWVTALKSKDSIRTTDDVRCAVLMECHAGHHVFGVYN